MKMLSETFISLCDLAEAEGRLLKQKTLQTVSVVLLMLVAVVFLGVAVALLLAAFFQSVLTLTSVAMAYLLTASLSLLLAGGMLWIGFIINRKA